MDDHLDLLDVYAQIRNESVEYLISKYEAIIVEKNERTNDYPVTLQIKTIVADYEVKLLISLPFNFPDSFPKVKLDEHSFRKLYPLPHLSKSKTLCLFDDVLASPNPANPLGVIDAIIQKAKEVLTKGVSKQNFQDYTDEFETYWDEDSKGSYLSIVEPFEVPKEVYLVPFTYANWRQQGIFANQKSDAINWVQNLGGTVREEEIAKVLYIPLSQPMQFPFPKSNRDIYHLLKDNKLAIQALSEYLTKHKRPTKVLFSMQSDGDYSWGVWEHLPPMKEVVLKYKGWKRIKTSMDGFRKDSRHGLLEIVKEFPKREIAKYSVEDVRAVRLKKRGGDGKSENHGLKIAIIGCGALGSHIAQSMFDIGIEHLLLVDYDVLSFENINRHLCGASDVGQPKTEAVKSKLRKHYPTSQIHVYNRDVLSLLAFSPNALNSYDLIIVAISHFPTELRLNQLQIQGLINKPMLHVWVEPYLAGGHAIWINPEDKIHLKTIFDESGAYKYQILKDGNKYTKKELGCNTSYVPYGVLELKRFIFDLMLFIKQQLNTEPRRSKVFTWLGNITEQRKSRRLLAPKWVGATDFSTRFYDLENNQESVD
ncbi:ThiF family adenylyltransferase [Thermaerobacillus caldiproteolyticus]|uniref:Molybdopterin/thiamine biosynthesis adenylyltransferase n=1 Tax=Thermaerobacillus caldiproteolyticus TaxID=247480 RepID=A0A7V9Z972_9BACL|nr:ThiF family adenylyltransferase [Anoxybacillus caldiproteolyticus]MBA2876372.1 molybdopterin/thiamine biosynthesis adenylyltransferase [Anoxybacillus caldiproteolyticus]